MTTKEYNEVVATHADHLYRFVLRSIRDSERAHDLVQDSFERLWRNHRDILLEKAKSYLFSIAHNAMVDMIRKENRQIVTDAGEMPEASTSKQYTDLKEILNEAVNRLPEIQRNVILLRDYEGYSYQEIGEITNLTESQVKVYIFRARAFLKKYIGQIESVI